LTRRPAPAILPPSTPGGTPLPEALHRYRWAIVALLAAPLLAAAILLLADRLHSPGPLQLDLDQPQSDLRVYVTGAVRYPGVYPLQPGDRWLDALEAAGGPSDDADLTAVDLARRARDEDTIVVPAAASAVQAPDALDLNSASADQLEALPGIGEVRAARIVASRDADGPFASADELLERDLIPASVYEEIAALVTAGP
jgi:DNA uptake protein ComE-like DNA-binding protein